MNNQLHQKVLKYLSNHGFVFDHYYNDDSGDFVVFKTKDGKTLCDHRSFIEYSAENFNK